DRNLYASGAFNVREFGLFSSGLTSNGSIYVVEREYMLTSRRADMPRLDAAARTASLKGLPEWRGVEGRDAIMRTFRFKGVNAAFGFMARVALVVGKMDHHPEWFKVFHPSYV